VKHSATILAILFGCATAGLYVLVAVFATGFVVGG
jgi:hypothetical protein